MMVDLVFLHSDQLGTTLAICPADTGSMSWVSGPTPDRSFELLLSLQVLAESVWVGAVVEATVSEPDSAPTLVIDGKQVALTDHVVNLDGWHGTLGPLKVGPPR